MVSRTSILNRAVYGVEGMGLRMASIGFQILSSSTSAGRVTRKCEGGRSVKWARAQTSFCRRRCRVAKSWKRRVAEDSQDYLRPFLCARHISAFRKATTDRPFKIGYEQIGERGYVGVRIARRLGDALDSVTR